jgi:hypothetical protein
MWPTKAVRENMEKHKKSREKLSIGASIGTSLLDTFWSPKGDAETATANTAADKHTQYLNNMLSSGLYTGYKRANIEFRCLPHFIIAGAQKSGTTALSG